jgi:hypothetical protein
MSGFTGEFYWVAPTAKSIEDKLETKGTNQSAVNQTASKTIDAVPDNVSNYRVAMDVSPRVCGNCRFFEGADGVTGNCKIYSFSAKANHLCDAWQAVNLTPTHTPVRATEI